MDSLLLGKYNSLSSKCANLNQQVEGHTAQLADIAYGNRKYSGYGMQNYVRGIGKVLEAFEATTGWSTTGTVELDTTNYKRGTSGLKINANTAGQAALATKTVSVRLVPDTQIRFWVYCHDPIANISAVRLYLSSVADFSKYFLYDMTLQIVRQGWNLVCVHTDSLINTNDSLTNQMITLRFTVIPTAGNTLSITVDAMDCNVVSDSNVIITFDDGYRAVREIAYPIMAPLGMVGVTYVVPTLAGSGAYMSVAQMMELSAAGWDIGNHSYAHSNYTGMSQADIETSIQQGQAWLVSNGLSTAARHFAIPFGIQTADVTAAIAASNLLTARTSTDGTFCPKQWSELQLPAKSIGNTTTLSSVIGWIEGAVSRGETIIIMLHNLAASPADAYDWSTANFQALCNYMYQRGIRTKSISDWYDHLS